MHPTWPPPSQAAPQLPSPPSASEPPPPRHELLLHCPLEPRTPRRHPPSPPAAQRRHPAPSRAPPQQPAATAPPAAAARAAAATRPTTAAAAWSRCLITLLHPPPEVREAHRAALLPLAQLLGLGRRRRRRIVDRPLVPTTMPSMLHLSRVPEDNEHAMHLHRVASGSSKLTGNAGDVPQLPAVQAPPPYYLRITRTIGYFSSLLIPPLPLTAHLTSIP